MIKPFGILLFEILTPWILTKSPHLNDYVYEEDIYIKIKNISLFGSNKLYKKNLNLKT